MPQRHTAAAMTYLAREASARFFSRRLSPLQVVVLCFLAVIFIGTALLVLPFAQRPSAHIGLLTSLFTATSATCLVGLNSVPFDLWSPFGTVVILLMVQLGAIGYMSAVMLIALLLGVRMGMPQTLAISRSGGVIGSRDLWRIVRAVALITLSIEGIGAFLLMIRFVVGYHQPLSISLVYGIAYSVMAFCNTGFPGQVGLDLWLLCILSVLFILGGLGIGVLIEIGLLPRSRTFSLHTKLALVTTAVLLVLGTVLIYLFESRNPVTFGMLPGGWSRGVVAWFLSASARSAGFTPGGLAALSPPSLLILALLTIVGGSPGGTGGGVKTTTLAIIVLAIAALVRHRMDIDAYRRRISGELVRLALSLVSFYLLIVLLLSIGISLTESHLLAQADPMSYYVQVLFTAVSAFGNVGWGNAAILQPGSKVLLILAMFLGRLGTLGFVYFFSRSKQPQLRRLPTETVMAG